MSQIYKGLERTEFIGRSQAWLFKFSKASSSLRNLQYMLKAPRAAVSSRPQATHPPSDQQQNYRSTSALYEPCLQTLQLAERQRAQLDSASEARCSAVQSMAPGRLLPPLSPPDKERPTRQKTDKQTDKTPKGTGEGRSHDKRVKERHGAKIQQDLITTTSIVHARRKGSA